MPQTVTPPRPRLKQALTVTALGIVQIRNGWRAYFRGVAAEYRRRPR